MENNFNALNMFVPFNKIISRIPQSPLSDFESLDIEDPRFQEAIYLASKDLFAGVEKFKLNKNENPNFEKSLHKYWIRKCTRCTPYGTFASVGICDLKETPTNIIVDDNKTVIKHTRIDMNCLLKIVKILEKEVYNYEDLILISNNSLYSVGNGFRYAEYTIESDSRIYSLSNIAWTEYIDAIIEKCSNGISFSDLIFEIQGLFSEYEVDEIISFIWELLENQILFTDLIPPVTGEEPLQYVINRCKRYQFKKPVLINHLERLNKLTLMPGKDISTFKEIDFILNQFDIEFSKIKSTIQVDSFIPFHTANLAKDEVNEICQYVYELTPLLKNFKNPDLEFFIEKFRERYEDQEIPINEVLDPEMGIGYAGFSWGDNHINAYIDGVVTSNNNREETIENDNVFKFITSKYLNFLENRENQQSLKIEREDLLKLKEKNDIILPASIYIMGNLTQNLGQYSFSLSGIGGPSGANLLGRFAHGSERVRTIIEDILKQEQDAQAPDTIFAEIAHLPNDRIGNILIRPCFREYEIAYIGESGTPKTKQIKLSDITVQIVGGGIQLKCKKNDKVIIPRLSTAHNYSFNSLPIYKFLCDLQNQEPFLNNFWNWGIFDNQNYLPRVEYRNIIVKKAKWNIKKNEFNTKSFDKFKAEFECFKKMYQVSDLVSIVDGDNFITIRTSNFLHLEILFDFLKKSNVVVEEFLFKNNNSVIKDENNKHYANEFIIPVVNENYQSSILNQVRSYNLSVKRSSAPGDDWLYIKIYCGAVTAESILLTKIRDFIFTNKGLFSSFFFVRYFDTDSHLRIRFYVPDRSLHFHLYNDLMCELADVINEKLIFRVVLDQYDRELERYTPDFMLMSERIFSCDSIFVIDILYSLQFTDSTIIYKDKILIALKIIDTYLEVFKLSITEKHVLLKTISHQFLVEFGDRKSLEKQTNKIFRDLDKDVKLFFLESNYDSVILKFKSELSTILIDNQFFERASNNKNLIFHLLQSYIHMAMNRLFTVQQRKYEMVLYSILERIYNGHLRKQQQ